MSRDPLVELVFAVAGSGPDPARVVELAPDWTLEELEASGLGLIVRSEVLGREVIFASTRFRPRRGESRPVYRVPELRVLAVVRPKSSELRRIDEVREVLLGRIVGSTEPTPSLPFGSAPEAP